MSESVSTGSLTRWLSRSANSGSGDRRACCIPGDVRFGAAAFSSDGLILELSARELVFREASHYILDRSSGFAHVSFLDMIVMGTVVATLARGYLIRLSVPLEDALVENLLDEYGIELPQ